MTAQRMISHAAIFCLMLGCLMLFLSFNDGAVTPQRSPFGVSVPAAPVPVGSDFLRENLSWVYEKQAAFYKSLTAKVKDAKTSGTAVWLLIGLSFLYGIFHAAGPGHGKIVISTYMLANEQSAKRGMIISFIAAFMQGLVAVVLIGMAVFLFNLSSMVITETTHFLERASYSLIAILGVYLLYQKGILPFQRAKAAAAEDAQLQLQTSAAGDHAHAHSHAGCDGHDHTHHDHTHHDHACSCGGHAVDPVKTSDPLSLRSTWAAIASVGLRPCSGALIVLVFAASQGLFWVGVAATFAMALGTGITVTSLATIALVAKRWATSYLSVTGASGMLFKSIELLGASLVFLLGITLLSASFQA